MAIFNLIWRFISDESKQKTLAWLGGTLVAVCTVVYGGYKAVSNDEKPPAKKSEITEKSKNAEVSAAVGTSGDCSPVVGGNFTGGNLSLDCSSKEVEK
jgi:hypothetical protein